MTSWNDIIRNNFWLKVFSLGLALLIWLAINSALQTGQGFSLNPWNKPQTRDFNIPVKLLILPEQGQGFAANPPEVKVVVQGDQTALEALTVSDVLVYAQVTDVDTPKGSFLVDVRVPREFTVKEYTPKRVSVEITPTSFMFFPPTPIQ